MGRVESKAVQVIKNSLYCNSCYNTEMVILPKESYSSFRYMCPKCHATDMQQTQYPIIEYITDDSILRNKLRDVIPQLVDNHELDCLIPMVVEIFQS